MFTIIIFTPPITAEKKEEEENKLNVI